ncbi:MAG: hypothetical protein WC369_09825 [Dehalococcoidales bacterium]|jgi:uncharacterized membrane protein YphA (DoxX/SURF4 family)
MSARQIKRGTLPGIIWILAGSAGIIERGIQAWRVWVGTGDYPAVILSFGLWGVVSLVSLLAGIGILTGKNWGRITAAVLSPILLILGIFGVAALPFYRDDMLTTEIAIRTATIAVITVPLGAYTLYRFFKGRKPDERKA